MITENQDAVIACLSDPATYGPGVSAVERIDTHTASVFLAGDRAYKLKRAVRYDYLDFSTAARRRACCEAEVALNRRTAPRLYLGIQPIARDAAARLSLDGQGDPVDWVVCMTRFDSEALFDRLAARHELPLGMMPGLARAVRHLHDVADRRPAHGGRDGLAWVIDGNVASFAELNVFDARVAGDVAAGSDTALERHQALLDARRAAGWVRACHGDLHLRNIALIDGAPTLFDAVEFNDRISCVDVLYDLAFLLMDLWRLGLTAHANVVLNEYIASRDDRRGLAALPLFLSCRSAVRAKTGATAAGLQGDPRQAETLLASAREYLRLAGRLLDVPPARLVAIGGPSGTGKSTIARRIAPDLGAVPGALVLRSDVVRKELAGAGPHDRLAPRWYRPDVSQHVYRTLAACAGDTLGAGHSVVVDAVSLQSDERAMIAGVAAAAGVSFHGVWLDAPGDTLVARVRARQVAARDASDADETVVRAQLVRAGDAAAGWTRVDASAAIDEVEARVRDALSTV